jgi:hypothetical protein
VDRDAIDTSGDLADELADNDIAERPYVDPRSIPTRFSLLKTLDLSPAHYREACQRPQDDSLAARLGGFATDRKEALRFGTAVHCFLLDMRDKVARYSGKRDKRVKAYQDFVAEQSARGVLEILNDKEWHRAVAVANAIRRHKTAMRLLFDGTKVEQRIDWRFCGRAIRSTPDARGRTHEADLKTTVSAEPSAFFRHAGRFFYHAQAWLYAEAMEAETGTRPSDCYLIAVEKTPPVPVSVFRFTDRDLELGEKLCRTWIERLKVCEATDEWPEYLQDIADTAIAPDDLGLEFNGKRIVI